MDQKEDVLSRLDTLLNPGEVESGPSSNASSCSSTPSGGILKTCINSNNKKKSIRFREETDLQEVIGFGGEDNLDTSSDEDEPPIPRTKYNQDQENEEMSIEEKNILNLTRQNTTFNTHAQNLNGNSETAPLLRLGVDKKVTPMITVRPFGMRNSEKVAINKVQPMINGEVVSCNNNKEDHNSGRGESRQNCSLNSDGASSETSSDASSSSEAALSESASDDQDSDTQQGSTSNNIANNNNNTNHSAVRPSSVIEREFFKAKQTAATARLSFLNSTIAFEAKGEPTTEIVSNWVKTPEDEDEIDEAARVNKKKNVKLTRKSPYVVGPYASTAILKGTPKPAINVRKPLAKPPVPAKPEKLQISSCSSSAGSCSTSSSGSVSPIAAPRRQENNNSVKTAQSSPLSSTSSQIQPRINDFVNNVKSEVTISADESTRIELSSNSSEDSEEISSIEGTTSFAECYTVNADVKNAIILDVSCETSEDATEVPSRKQSSSPDHEIKNSISTIPEAPKLLPKVQQNFNQMALDAIRMSLTNKISVQEELTDKDDEDVEKIISKSPWSRPLATPHQLLKPIELQLPMHY